MLYTLSDQCTQATCFTCNADQYLHEGICYKDHCSANPCIGNNVQCENTHGAYTCTCTASDVTYDAVTGCGDEGRERGPISEYFTNKFQI